ncbi:MAG: chemotaxis protein CheC [Deltaproteobacteria bacterium]|nr:chemotaxis protein CheC [Deltaproteobacteria bacterium]
MSVPNEQIVTAGAQEAAAALQRLLRVPVSADTVVALDVAQLASTHGPRAVVIAFDTSGGVTGTLALVIDDAVAAWLAGRLTGAVTLDGAIGKGALAALAELGNIVASAFLNGAARVVGRTCLPSVPRLLHAATAEALTAASSSSTSASTSASKGAAAASGSTLRVATLRVQQQWFSVVFSG